MYQLLAQTSEIGILQTLLEGGVPLLLLVAVVLLAKLYYKEKEDSRKEMINHSTQIISLKDDYSKKVEKLLRERIDSEADVKKMLIEAKDVMEAVVITMERMNDLMELAVKEANNASS